jgi:hypothetical protein
LYDCITTSPNSRRKKRGCSNKLDKRVIKLKKETHNHKKDSSSAGKFNCKKDFVKKEARAIWEESAARPFFPPPSFKLQKSSSNPLKQKEKQEDLCTHSSQIIKISGGKKKKKLLLRQRTFSNEIAKNKKKTRQAKNRERII